MPAELSTEAQVMPEMAVVYLPHAAVVPGAAVPGGATRYADTRRAARLTRVTLVSSMLRILGDGDVLT